jgi:transposase-like protein
MAAWVLDCPACNKTFVHSQITTASDQRMMDHFYPVSVKPEFPTTGVSVECPNCRSSFVFKQYQLRYNTH